MKELGEIKKASELGRRGSFNYMWSACVDCGKERWVYMKRGIPANQICRICAGKRRGKANYGRIRERASSWKGGRTKTNGYIMILLDPQDFFWGMSNSIGRVAEHRLVIAKSLGRCLHSWEIVHHKNGNRLDNRLENLQLVTDDRHKQITILENRIKILEGRVTLLEAENIILKQQLEASIENKY